MVERSLTERVTEDERKAIILVAEVLAERHQRPDLAEELRQVQVTQDMVDFYKKLAGLRASEEFLGEIPQETARTVDRFGDIERDGNFLSTLWRTHRLLEVNNNGALYGYTAYLEPTVDEVVGLVYATVDREADAGLFTSDRLRVPADVMEMTQRLRILRRDVSRARNDDVPLDPVYSAARSFANMFLTEYGGIPKSFGDFTDQLRFGTLLLLGLQDEVKSNYPRFGEFVSLIDNIVRNNPYSKSPNYNKLLQ